VHRLCDERTALVQAMDGFGMGPGAGCDIPGGLDVRGLLARSEGDRAPAVDVLPIERGRRQLMPVERGVARRDGRPGARVGGAFAGEIARIELV
jgi:hypothetical protein